MFNRFSSTTPQPQPPQTATNSFFGSAAPAPTTSPFGGSFASQAPTALPPSTAIPSTPYSFTNELENGITIKLLSISAMPAYRHLSQEEIRVDDYMKGRKGPSSFPGSKPGAFSTPFSGASNTANRFPYSSSSAAATPSSSVGAFGSSAYGSTPSTTSGLFGTNAFGSTAPTTSAPTSSFG